MPTLSVCCMTAGPAGRVSRMLTLLRPVADEIVVAVDDRAGEDVAAALADVADRVVWYPYAEPVDRPLPWLHAHVEGDWLLTVDDDEIPSAALVAELPTLLAAQDVTHYWLPRLWLYPDAAHVLDAQPWRPDYQLRLVENDPRLLGFPDETHRPVTALGPGRYLAGPLYHAALVLASAEQRRRKARQYERRRPGKRVAGRPLNVAFFLPEDAPSAPTVAVGDEDRVLIESVLSATESPRRPVPELPRASREEIDRVWSRRTFGEGAYRAALEPLEPAPSFTAREQRTLGVRVENRGDEWWPWGEEGEPAIRLSYHWLNETGETVVHDGLRTPLPASLAPGQSQIVPVHVLAPPAPGRYRLQIDLVHEEVRWFGLDVAVDAEVRPARRVAVVGGPDVIVELAERAPELEPLLVPANGAQLRSALPHVEVLLLAAPTEPGTRSLLATLRLARAARRHGARVLARTEAVPETRGMLDRALKLLLRRTVEVLPDGELDLRARS